MPTPEEKNSLLSDTIAAIGFFAVITVALWGTGNVIRVAPSIFSALVPSSTTVATKATTSNVIVKPNLSPAALVTAERRQQQTALQKIDFSRYHATTTLVQKKAPAVATSKKSTTKTAAPVGRPDLSVSITAVGMIDPTTGIFIERMPMDRAEIGAVRFVVRNVGSAASGSWRFSASLPVSTDESSYSSVSQPSLSPGGYVSYTLRFNNTVPGDDFIVRVDPGGHVNESRTSNNTASVRF